MFGKNKYTQTIITNTLNKALKELPIDNFNINKIRTIHQSKNLFGKFIDWFKWKTFFAPLFYKPFYISVLLKDELIYLRDYGHFNISDEEFYKIIEQVGFMQLFKEQYPQNPYTTYNIDISISTMFPVNYIKVDFEVKDPEK